MLALQAARRGAPVRRRRRGGRSCSLLVGGGARRRGRRCCSATRLRRRRRRAAEPRPPTAARARLRREPPDRALAPFYGQELDVGAVRRRTSARPLEVPLDYDRPRGRTIELAAAAGARPRASGRARLVVNPGGPGAPGTEYAAARRAGLRRPAPRALRRRRLRPARHRRQRAGRLPDRRRARRLPRRRPRPRRRGRATRARRARSSEFGARAASADDAELAAHVSTIEAARDMDVLRAALGRRAARLLRRVLRHQARRDVRRAVPEQGRPVRPRRRRRRVADLARAQPRAGRAASRPRCGPTSRTASRPSTPASSATPSTRGWPGSPTSSTRSTREPLPTGDGPGAHGRQRLLRDRRRRSTTATTGHPAARRCAPASTATASRCCSLADLYASRGPDGGYTDNSAEAIYAINCLDDPFAIRAGKVPAQLPAFEEASPTFGDVFAWGLAGCLGPGRRVDRGAARRSTARARAPIVVIGTTRDPATPYEWAEALADQLESGVLVTPRRRRPHRLQRRQRLRRRGRRGLPARGHGPRRRPHLLSVSAGLIGSAIAWIRLVASSIISRAAGESVAPARCTIGERVELPRAQRRHARRPVRAAGSSCSAAPRGITESASPIPTSSTAVSTSSTSIRVCGLWPVSCSIWRSMIRVESSARQVVSGMTSEARASRCGGDRRRRAARGRR